MPSLFGVLLNRGGEKRIVGATDLWIHRRLGGQFRVHRITGKQMKSALLSHRVPKHLPLLSFTVSESTDLVEAYPARKHIVF